MKGTMFSLAIAGAMLMLACQESNPISPSGTRPPQTIGFSKALPADNTIIQFRTVVTVGAGQSYEVVGRVKYALTQLPIMREDLFDLVLDTEAKINQLDGNGSSWRIGNMTTRTINLTAQNSVQVDEWYFIQGGPSSMYLHLQFDVTPVNVSLLAVTIE